MTYYKKMITIAFAALLFQNTAIADTKYEVEIDPSTFALNGYAFHARILPESMPQWRLGAGIYSMEFPDIFIDMNALVQSCPSIPNLEQATFQLRPSSCLCVWHILALGLC